MGIKIIPTLKYPLTRENLCWAAGLFDGEGSVGVSYQRGNFKLGNSVYYPLIRARVQMTDFHSVKRFYRYVGDIGTIYGPYKKTFKGKQVKSVLSWDIVGFEGTQALVAMLWFKLGEVKREQYEECVNAYLNTDPQVRIY